MNKTDRKKISVQRNLYLRVRIQTVKYQVVASAVQKNKAGKGSKWCWGIWRIVSLPIETGISIWALSNDLGALDFLKWWGIKGIVRLVLKVSRQFVEAVSVEQ